MRRLTELQGCLQRGEISQTRLDKEAARIEQVADEIAEKAEVVANRVIENLGERLEAALRTYRVEKT